MFYIFGWGRTSNKDLGPAIPITCPNCNNTTAWHLIHHKKWFTLFFLPFFPYESIHALLCPICTHGLEIKGEHLEHAKRLVLAINSQKTSMTSDDEINALLNSDPSNNLRQTVQSSNSPQISDSAPISICPNCDFKSFNSNCKVCPVCHQQLKAWQAHSNQ